MTVTTTTTARSSSERRAGVAVLTAATGSALVAATAGALLVPLSRVDVPAAAAVGGLSSISGLATALVLTVLGALVVLRGTAGRYGWLMVAAGTVLSLVHLGQAVSALGVWGPGAWPDVAVRAALWLQDLWMVWFACIVLWLPTLFPSGAAPAPWRGAVRILSWVWALVLLIHWFIQRPAQGMFVDLPIAPPNPTSLLPLPMDVLNLGWAFATFASVVVTIGSAVSRWRRAGHEERQQLKVVLNAFAIVAVVMGALIVNTGLVESGGLDLGIKPIIEVALNAAWVWVAVALGIAVLQHRIYDVDLVINRTLVYGVMLALVTATYVAVVVGAGALLPQTDDTGRSLAATVLVAIGFAPVRTRVQRAINRLVFGQRDDPLAVLDRLGDVLERAATPRATLADAARTVAEALKLPGVAVELSLADDWERAVAHGSLHGVTESLPLRHGGEAVGRLVVARRSPAEALRADDRRVLEAVAHHLAALAHSLQLTVALQRSRERLVMAREEERRRLRRDLHDGFGPTLASQALWLDTVRDQLRTDPEAAASQLTILKGQTQQLVSDIRTIVHQLRPPALDELGVVGAIESHIANLPQGTVAVELDADGAALGTLDAAVEVAAYRIAIEALTNVVRHAAATRCLVQLRRDGDSLRVSVSDDGLGAPSDQPSGVGTRSMRERAEELGGTLHLEPRPGGGTLVEATLPAPSDPSIDMGPPRKLDGIVDD